MSLSEAEYKELVQKFLDKVRKPMIEGLVENDCERNWQGASLHVLGARASYKLHDLVHSEPEQLWELASDVCNYVLMIVDNKRREGL